MVTTGRMAYGEVPHHDARHPHHPPSGRTIARRVVLALVMVAVLAGSAGWVEHNWRSFDNRTDSGLCHLMQNQC
jgi:hypothetical protein